MKLKFLTPALITLVFIANVHADWLTKAKDFLEQSGVTSSATELTEGEITAGLKEALKVSSHRVVNKIGTVNGFNGDPNIHIPLPKSLQKAQSLLSNIGLSGTLDDLETRLNQAAEIATPKAKAIFLQAIATMTLDDARTILSGKNDAATRYFQSRMTPDLVKEFTPIVNNSLAKAGAIQSYDNAMSRYQKIPFAPDVTADLSRYVVNKGMDGIFYYLAVEEAKIRTNPAARTTALLKKVFAQ